MSPDRKLLPLLDRVKCTGTGKWIALCPAHQDRSPSLSVKQLEDGRILLKCWAGCAAAGVLHAVGLQFSDLYPEDTRREFKATQPRQRWIPRDALAALSTDIWLVMLAAEKAHSGEKLTDDERDLLNIAADRLWMAYIEVAA